VGIPKKALLRTIGRINGFAIEFNVLDGAKRRAGHAGHTLGKEALIKFVSAKGGPVAV